MKMKAVKKPVKEKINPKELHKEFLSSLEDELENQGVVFWETEKNLNIEEEYLFLPRDITNVTSRELGNYLNAFTQQKMYIRTLLGRTEIEVEKARKKYIESSEQVYKTLSTNGKLSETAKERIINAEENVKPYYYSYLEWLQRKNLLISNITNIEDAIFLISREVSRRTSDFADENRNYNVGKQ